MRTLLLLLVASCAAVAGLYPRRPSQVRMVDYATCSGTVDDTASAQKAIDAAAGRSVHLEAGCQVLLARPTSGVCRSGVRTGGACTLDTADATSGCGSGATCPGCCEFISLRIPNNTRIVCEDGTAGFRVARRSCKAGTYVGASCDGTATSCQTGSASDCVYDTGSSPYAPTPDAVYAMLWGKPLTRSIQIENCSLWTHQADPYQRCSGGTKGGLPCYEYCSSGSAVPGMKCEVDGDCITGACTNTADCTGGGGTCSAAPQSPSGPGKIDPLDLSNTFSATVRNVSIYDHFIGEFGIRTQDRGRIVDTNVARELNDCTRPEIGSSMFPFAGRACYGAAENRSLVNAQPTVGVAEGIHVGQRSHIERSYSRGATSAFTAGDYARVDQCTVWPEASAGPGRAATGTGYSVGQRGEVANSQALYMGAGSLGINLSGQGATAIENRIEGSYKTAIQMSAANQRATGNNIKGLTGAYCRNGARNGSSCTLDTTDGTNGCGSGATCPGCCAAYGVDAQGNYDYVGGNYIEGNAIGAGVRMAGTTDTVSDNSIVSNATNTLDYGVKVETAGSVTNNRLYTIEKAAIWVSGATFGTSIVDNDSILSAPNATGTRVPIHVLLDGGAQQTRVVGNHFSGGWRGLSTGTNASALSNINISNNRFVLVGGASVAMSGAGVTLQSNYFNTSNTWLVCDASCNTNQGLFCVQDSDCGTCSSPQKCIPDTTINIGSPQNSRGSAHPMLASNLIYDGNAPTKQCGGTTIYPGSVCTATEANGTCTGGASCTGGPPPTCASGTDVGKYCCAGATPTCTARTDKPLVRLLEWGSVTGHSDLVVVGNNFLFGAVGASNFVGIDFVSSGSFGNLKILRGLIAGNNFEASSLASATGIKFPTSWNQFYGLGVMHNTFNGFATNIANWSPGMGARWDAIPESVDASGAVSQEALPVREWKVEKDDNITGTTMLATVFTGIGSTNFCDAKLCHTINVPARWGRPGTPRDLIDPTGTYYDCATGSASGNAAGFESASGRFTQTRADQAPVLTAVIGTGGTISTDTTYWIALTSSDVAATTSPTNHIAGLRFNATTDAATWYAYTADGSAGTPIKLDGSQNSPYPAGPTVRANTRYIGKVILTPSDATFVINGVTVWRTRSTLPASTQSLGVEVTGATRTTASRSIRISKVALAHN